MLPELYREIDMIERKTKPGKFAAIVADSCTEDGTVLSRSTHEVFGFATQVEADEFLQISIDALQSKFRELGELKLSGTDMAQLVTSRGQAKK